MCDDSNLNPNQKSVRGWGGVLQPAHAGDLHAVQARKQGIACGLIEQSSIAIFRMMGSAISPVSGKVVPRPASAAPKHPREPA